MSIKIKTISIIEIANRYILGNINNRSTTDGKN